MSVTALTRVGLPVMEEREVYKDVFASVPTGETIYKEPGDTITKSELKELGWTDEKIEADLAELTKYNSLGSKEDWEKILADREEEAERLAQAEADAVLAVRERFARERQKANEGGAS